MGIVNEVIGAPPRVAAKTPVVLLLVSSTAIGAAVRTGLPAASSSISMGPRVALTGEVA